MGGKQLDQFSFEGVYQEKLRQVTEEEETKRQIAKLQQFAKTNGLPSMNVPSVQHFGSGATRSADGDKNDYEGFLSFPAVEEFGDYMTRHRKLPDGSTRDSDNWQKGIPITSYMKSLVRHALELWGLHRGVVSKRLRKEYPLQASDVHFLKRETVCALWFNVQGYLHELMKLPGNPVWQQPQQQQALPTNITETLKGYGYGV